MEGQKSKYAGDCIKDNADLYN